MTPNNNPEKKFSTAPAAPFSIDDTLEVDILNDASIFSRFFPISA